MGAFVFRKDYEFEQAVAVKYPGGRVEGSFMARFRLPDETEEASLRGPYSSDTDVAVIYAEDRTRMASILMGWSGVEDADGKPFAFNEENRDELLSQRVIVKALWAAFWEALRGELRAKN